MRENYKKRLTILTIILIILGIILVFYYLWKIDNNTLAANTASCVDIIYSDELNYNLVNPESLRDSDGKGASARSISITNKCSDIKTIQLYLDVLNTSTINSNKIKTYINGDITLEPILLSDLKTLKNDDESIKEKKRLYKYDLEPNKSIRLNLRMWLDEYAALSQDKNTFYGTYEIVATDQIIKPTFVEKLLKDNPNIINNIDYSSEIVETGLVKLNNTYYFRGNPVNNYFKIDDYILRIVGINSDNSIKLAFTNNLLDSQFNEYSNKEETVVFNTSTASTVLDAWYEENISKYDEYLVTKDYCVDTTYTKYYSQITYGGNKRLFDEDNPSLVCNAGDRDYGGKYSSKVGILSADELSIIGFNSKFNNQNNYLFLNKDTCTTTPYSYYYGAYITVLNKEGKLSYMKVNNTCTMIPIININGHLTIKGEGTVNSPYELDLDD